MVEHEADDALAAAAAVAAADARVEQVLICTPDKDLAQCVSGSRVVLFDRRKRVLLDDAGVREKYGVPPASIPDWLALVGDTADGYPGLPGFGAKSAAALLARWGRLEDDPGGRGALGRAAARRGEARGHARRASGATRALPPPRDARGGRPAVGRVDDWRWRGPREGFDVVASALGRCRSRRASAGWRRGGPEGEPHPWTPLAGVSGWREPPSLDSARLRLAARRLAPACGGFAGLPSARGAGT